jgi:hypothetical protein
MKDLSVVMAHSTEIGVLVMVRLWPPSHPWIAKASLASLARRMWASAFGQGQLCNAAML